ncbi:hypothetical protein R3P38DRAFT_3220232 [Favolaschia claudopus]|uniref:Uncharacterized protein n=1 Tax=Favolaschia claudopus TaxID=2862362 RepID=A0AAW0A1R9_9AGAR
MVDRGRMRITPLLYSIVWRYFSAKHICQQIVRCSFAILDSLDLFLYYFKQPANLFPHHPGKKLPQIDFALIPERGRTAEVIWQSTIRFTSRAFIIGMRLQDTDSKMGTGTNPFNREDLFLAAQSHLDALLVAPHQSLLADASLPPACLFGIAFRASSP